MRLITRQLPARLQRLGWITLLAFTVKGLVSTSLILWAVASTLD